MQTRFLPVIFVAVALLAAIAVAAPTNVAGDKLVLKRSHTYKGTATWYKPKSEGGPHGACGGVKIDNDSEIVALNHKQYGDLDDESKWCGKKIKITGPKGTAKAKIMDACPECGKNDLDLTPVLFKQVAGDMDKGEADIEWELI